MPPTVHKILDHGIEIIQHFSLPIGFLSEDALEARHKEIRKYRSETSRKNSRMNCLNDVFKRMLQTSEPIIAKNRRIIERKEKNFDDIRRFLILPEKCDE